MAWLTHTDPGAGPDPLERVAERLAHLLVAPGDTVSDPTGSDLVFETQPVIAPFPAAGPPSEVWAVDGGQALVADARCLQLYVTRAARVCWRDGSCVLEEEGELIPHLMGGGQDRATLAALESPVDPRAAVDINLLRDWGEWRAVADTVARARPDSVVLIDGDLQPDWRIPASWLAATLAGASERRVLPVGVTKHSSLARGGTPLLGLLERQAEEALGPRARWWTRVATTRPEIGPGLQVLMARLDPDARFAFRVDLPGGVDPVAALGSLAAVCDDAAFPGYPYPLSVADRLASCPGWIRTDVWQRVEDHLDRRGVASEIRERAFADRHRLMERA